MTKVKIIIGANYGDEGKGLLTNVFSRKAREESKRCLNILYNGGPQRGHTVDYKIGVKHVFHHFGSGTLANADTFFDKDFMVNPMEFVREYNELIELGYDPYVLIDPYCRVTTPYDMIVNRVVEEARGNERHGSVGMGIWETVQRCETNRSTDRYLSLSRLSDEAFKDILKIDRDRAFLRLHEYGVTAPEPYLTMMNSDVLIEHYLDDFRKMQRHVHEYYDNYDFIDRYDTVIFEGGQGLALDQDNVDEYPNVSASSTGSKIPIQRLAHTQFKHISEIEIVYVTRSYFTRHGAGRFPTECPVSEINPNIVDMTNIPNDYQGSIRYGTLDGPAMMRRINKDLQQTLSMSSNMHPDFKHSLAVTHLNYTDGEICGNCTINQLAKGFNRLYTFEDKYGRKCGRSDL